MDEYESLNHTQWECLRIVSYIQTFMWSHVIKICRS